MITLKLTPIQRTTIVAALWSYDFPTLAKEIADMPDRDTADDGPEVELILAGKVEVIQRILTGTADRLDALGGCGAAL